MKKTKKAGIVLIAIFFALVISPGIALSEAYATNNSYEKTVRIAGLDGVSFIPNTINITKGDIIVLTGTVIVV